MKKLLYLILTVGMIALAGCRPDCDVPVGDTLENPSSADFKIGVYLRGAERANLRDTLVVSDTCLEGRIHFVGPQGFDSYEWTIGSDTRTFSDREFSLIFDPEPLIRVQLIVSGPAEPRCFGNEDGRDTAVQYFTILPHRSSLTYGTYRGVMDSAPTDTFELTYNYDFDDSRLPIVINFPKNCTVPNGRLGGKTAYRIGEIGRRLSYIYYQDYCLDPVGYVYVSADGESVEIPFSTAISYQDNLTRIPDRFTGVRVE